MADEQSTSYKGDILTQSENFLTGLKAENNSYVQFNDDDASIADLYRTILGREPTLAETQTTSLTGAIGALLPMTFAIADKSGDRLIFTLLVNPENVNHGKTASVQLAYTRKGYTSQFWGSGQDILTATGKSAAFMAPSVGMTSFSRRMTFGFKNFMSMLGAYRNNGYTFADPVNFQNTLTRVIDTIRGVEITYDDQSFMGHFNNFTVDESAESPVIFDFNFEFVISNLSNNYNEMKGHFIPINFVAPATVSGVTPVNRTLADVANGLSMPANASGIPKMPLTSIGVSGGSAIVHR